MLVSNDKVLLIKWRKGHTLFFILYNVLCFIVSDAENCGLKCCPRLATSHGSFTRGIRDLDWWHQGPRLDPCNDAAKFLISWSLYSRKKNTKAKLGILGSIAAESKRFTSHYILIRIITHLHNCMLMAQLENLGSWFPK